MGVRCARARTGADEGAVLSDRVNVAELGEQLRRLAVDVEQAAPVGDPAHVRIAVALRRISYTVDTLTVLRAEPEEPAT